MLKIKTKKDREEIIKKLEKSEEQLYNKKYNLEKTEKKLAAREEQLAALTEDSSSQLAASLADHDKTKQELAARDEQLAASLADHDKTKQELSACENKLSVSSSDNILIKQELSSSELLLSDYVQIKADLSTRCVRDLNICDNLFKEKEDLIDDLRNQIFMLEMKTDAKSRSNSIEDRPSIFNIQCEDLPDYKREFNLDIENSYINSYRDKNHNSESNPISKNINGLIDRIHSDDESDGEVDVVSLKEQNKNLKSTISTIAKDKDVVIEKLNEEISSIKSSLDKINNENNTLSKKLLNLHQTLEHQENEIKFLKNNENEDYRSGEEERDNEKINFYIQENEQYQIKYDELYQKYIRETEDLRQEINKYTLIEKEFNFIKDTTYARDLEMESIKKELYEKEDYISQLEVQNEEREEVIERYASRYGRSRNDSL